MANSNGPLPTVTRWTPLILAAARKYGVHPDILAAVIQHESGGQEGLTSSAGAKGLTQFMPGTAATYGVNTAPGHAQSQIMGEAHYLHDLKSQLGGSLYKALEGYAAGPGNLGAGASYASAILGIAPAYKGLTGGAASPVAPKQAASSSSSGSSSAMPGGISKDLLTQFVLAGGADNSSAVQGLASGMQASAAKPVSVKPVKAPSAPSVPGGSAPIGKAKIVAVKAPWNPASKPVGAWMVPILNWAHQHGWTGTVTSGYRNPAEQMQAARNYGLQHYGPGGPLASNHVSGNAVDVTQPAQLAQVLKGYTGPGKLVWGGPVIGDTPHFSQNGH